MQTQSSPRPPVIASGREAMLHLLLHCCHIDGECSEKELQTIRGIMQKLYGDEGTISQPLAAYAPGAAGHMQPGRYLLYLLQKIGPAHPAALLWYCSLVTVADRQVCFSEELFVHKLSALLQVCPDECKQIHRLALRVCEAEQNPWP